MKRYVIGLLLTYCLVPNTLAVSHTNKTIEILLSPDSRPCLFFKLVGVAEADPINPDNAWFAVPVEQVGTDTTISMLISASVAGKNVSVTTTGQLQCGLAELRNVSFSGTQ